MLYYLELVASLTARIGLAGLTAFVLGLAFVPLVVRYGRRRGFKDREGKSHSERLNELHAKKKDTPVLGGVAILAAALLAIGLWARVLNFYVILVGLTLAALAVVGIVDDFVKTFGRDKREGITPRQKLAAQISIGLAAGAALVLFYDGFRPLGASKAFALEYAKAEGNKNEPLCETAPAVATLSPEPEAPSLKNCCEAHKRAPESPRALLSLHVPFARDLAIPLGAVFFVLFCTLVMTGSSNAVNLTDGLDGLAGGCYVFAISVMGALAYVAGRADWSVHLGVPHVPGAGEVAVCAAALAGGTLAFLWFNAHPADLFMGDAGSLPLGGVLGLMAVVTKHELLLPLVGIVFVAEATSVIFQVSAFKLLKKRVLACAPLHHHFEFKGWAETKVVARFWIAGAIAALLSLASLVVRS